MKKKGWQVVEHKSGHDECLYTRAREHNRKRERERERTSHMCVARIKTDRQENIVLRRLPVVAEAKTAGASALAAHRAALAR